MSERAPRPERLVALFVTVLWAAVVFAADGVLANVLDRDPVESDVSPVASILSFVVAGFGVWLLLSGTSTSRQPLWGALGAVAVVYLAFVASAAFWGFELVTEQALSPFVMAAAVLAGVAVAATWWVLRLTRRGDPRDRGDAPHVGE